MVTFSSKFVGMSFNMTFDIAPYGDSKEDVDAFIDRHFLVFQSDAMDTDGNYYPSGMIVQPTNLTRIIYTWKSKSSTSSVSF